MKALKGKEVVVTGGAGFIGSHLCRTLIEQGAKATAFDNLSSGKIDFIEDIIDNGLKFVQGDIRDPTALEKATRNSEVIFHLAAQTSVPFSMEDAKEDCEINVVGTLNVLEAAKKADARVVFASSAAVYGNPDKRPTPETYPTRRSPSTGCLSLLVRIIVVSTKRITVWRLLCSAYSMFMVQTVTESYLISSKN